MVLSFSVSMRIMTIICENSGNVDIRRLCMMLYEWHIYSHLIEMWSIKCRYADKLIYANNYIIWMSFVRMIGWL